MSRKKCTIWGEIVDGETGQPLNCSVHVLIKDAHTGAGLNLAGEYEVGNISPGKYDVYFTGINYNEVVKRDVVIDGEITELNIKMDRKSVGANNIDLANNSN